MVIIMEEYANMFTDISFWLYIALLVSDILTGNIKAWVTDDVDSSVGKDGSLKHFALFGLVMLLLPTLNAYTGNAAFSITILGYYSYQNIISIIENLGALGWGVPPEVAKKMRRLKEKDDGQ